MDEQYCPCPKGSFTSIYRKSLKKKHVKKTEKKEKERATAKHSINSLTNQKVNLSQNKKVNDRKIKKQRVNVDGARRLNVNYLHIDNAGPFRTTKRMISIGTFTGLSDSEDYAIPEIPSYSEMHASEVLTERSDKVYPALRFGSLTGRQKLSNYIKLALEKMALDPDSENSETSIHREQKIYEPILEKRSITSLINAQYDTEDDL